MADSAHDPRIPSRDLSIVIPCHNEEATILAVLDDLAHHCPEAELLVVDDGSTDGTARLAEGRPCIRLLRHEQNRGYGAAIRTGCRAATRPYIVWFDGDGQHTAAMIAPLLAAFPKCDCAIGVRSGGQAASWGRRAGVGGLNWIARLLLMRSIPDLNCGLRVFRREVLLRYLDLLPCGFSASSTTTIAMLECGHRVAWVKIDRLARAGHPSLGGGHVRWLRDGLRTLRLIFRLVVLLSPWKLFAPPAVALGLAAFVAMGADHRRVAITLALCSLAAVMLGAAAQRRRFGRGNV